MMKKNVFRIKKEKRQVQNQTKMKRLIDLTKEKQNRSWHRQTFTEEKQFDAQTCDLIHCMTAKKKDL